MTGCRLSLDTSSPKISVRMSRGVYMEISSKDNYLRFTMLRNAHLNEAEHRMEKKTRF